MARNFDGSTGYLQSLVAPVTAEPLTLAGWFRSDITTQNQAIIKVGANAASAGWQLWITSGNNQVAATTVDAAQTAGAALSNPASPYTAGTWFHGAAVFTSASSRAAFINGGAKVTNATSITVAGVDSVLIGSRYLGGTLGSFFDGRLAEVGVWNVALSDEEVASLATGVSPLLVRPHALVSYVPVFGRASPEVDMVRADTLTVTGTAPVAPHPPIAFPTAPRIARIPAAAPGGGSVVGGRRLFGKLDRLRLVA